MRVGLGAQAGFGDADMGQQLGGAGGGGAGGEAFMGAQALGDLAADAVHRVQRGHRFLENHAHGAAAEGGHAGLGQGEQVVSGAVRVQGGAATYGGAREQAHQGQGGDALAGGGFTDDGQRLARLQLEGDAFDRGGGAEGDGQVLDVQQRGHRWVPRGSMASRKPSPRKLKPVTARVMAAPGKMASQGAEVRYSWAPFSMLPQLGVGGWMP